jgi:hypothetical protein
MFGDGFEQSTGFRTALRAFMSLLTATLLVAILDDGSGEGGPPDPLPPIETDV